MYQSKDRVQGTVAGRFSNVNINFFNINLIWKFGSSGNQSPFRTGLLKGAKEGLSAKDPTLAELLKPLGYTSGQFGKNHLGDRNEFLPTVHGFDEFFGNSYHLNAEEEPEQEFYPKDPTFRQTFAPRRVLHCYANNSFDSTADPRFGTIGKQKCDDTGPLTRKRMETVDEEFLKAAMDFMKRAHGFDVWQEPYVILRLPMLFNLRMDPFERAEESEEYPSLARRQCVGIHARASDCRAILTNLQRVSAAGQTGKLQSRSGLAEDAGALKQLSFGTLSQGSSRRLV